jgi:hypothetical protein
MFKYSTINISNAICDAGLSPSSYDCARTFFGNYCFITDAKRGNGLVVRPATVERLKNRLRALRGTVPARVATAIDEILSEIRRDEEIAAFMGRR